MTLFHGSVPVFVWFVLLCSTASSQSGQDENGLWQSYMADYRKCIENYSIDRSNIAEIRSKELFDAFSRKKVDECSQYVNLLVSEVPNRKVTHPNMNEERVRSWALDLSKVTVMAKMTAYIAGVAKAQSNDSGITSLHPR